MFIVIVMIASIAALKLYPSKKLKVPLTWIALGLSQVIFCGFSIFPPLPYNSFPIETTVGLFTSTCGVVLATPSIRRMKSVENIIAAGLGFLFLGFLELMPILVFYSFYQTIVEPEFFPLNFPLAFAVYTVFLAASIVTISCGILAFWKTESSLRTNAHDTQRKAG